MDTYSHAKDTTQPTQSARRIHITGVVQGVGFRPFVYNLATRLEVSGWVLNSSAGVEIKAVAPHERLEEFTQRLQTDAPPLARIEAVTITSILPPDTPPDGFRIRHSQARPGEFLPISPDVSICADCLRELFDPSDRRYRYPFINCTNCGPRFTIIRDIPYDRPNTTMAPFEMCPLCQAEYDDPTNRRFHAQPNACPTCGPQVWFQAKGGPVPPLRAEEAIQATRDLLVAGGIVAIKGLGGFHLACDATNDRAVARLRKRKGRVDKPFALMSFDLDSVERYCTVQEDEAALITARERPIVLLQERPHSPISRYVAPGNAYLGVMLPYTPLHYLLLEPSDDFPVALVMTSGNYSEEPIATDNDEALTRLAGLADGFLLHDREIHARCDDSVTRIFAGAELPIRRSRGYAPYPIRLPFDVPQVLAVGAELKNTFCLTRERYAFLSQHIGDLENYETLRFFEKMIAQLAHMFRIQPAVIACDMHPTYLSTRYAHQEATARSIALVPVQHHHAHIAACMAENDLTGEQPVIGVAFDGTGYGEDGAIWGGEFFVADYRLSRRVAHLAYIPLPGGDAAIRRPYRVALAHLWAAGIPWENDLPPVAAAAPTERAILQRQLERNINVVPTSSIGRLFDAVSALAGVCSEITYEAQAAIELEMLAMESGEEEGYPFDIVHSAASGMWEVRPTPCIAAVVADVKSGQEATKIAARFHTGLATMVRNVCVRLRTENSVNEVALSGGVFQNMTLLRITLSRLQAAGFKVYTHHQTPPNDACISLGQAMIAGATGGVNLA